MPALIVMVFVLVWTFFSSITGREATPAQNVERLLHGGANERTQAAFNLVRQAVEDWESDARGAGSPWAFDARVQDGLRVAWDENREIADEGDVPIPLAIAILLAQLGDEEGAERLAALTRLAPETDPSGQYRAYAGFVLGALGSRLPPEQRPAAQRALLDLLASDDQGLRMVGAIALQGYPGPETSAALRGLLVEASLELRGNAALALARLGDGAGSAVLREMLDPDAYRSERERERRKWARAPLVSESRCKALEALVALDEAPDAAALEALAESDPDPALRELARRLLRAGDATERAPE